MFVFCFAIFQNEDELSLIAGDVVSVTGKDDSGWWCGTCIQTGKDGLFPRNYVKLRVSAPAPPKRPPGLTKQSSVSNVGIPAAGEVSPAASLSSVASPAQNTPVSYSEDDVYTPTVQGGNRFSISSLDAFDEMMDTGVSVEIVENGSKMSPKSGSTIQPGMYVTLLCKAMIWDGANSTASPFASTTGTAEAYSASNRSADPNAFLSFLVGRGHVSPGLDCAMIRLRVSDEAVIACSPAMGYGEAGNPPHIPSNAHIVYEVKILNAVKGENQPAIGPSALITQIIESRRMSLRSVPSSTLKISGVDGLGCTDEELKRVMEVMKVNENDGGVGSTTKTYAENAGGDSNTGIAESKSGEISAPVAMGTDANIKDTPPLPPAQDMSSSTATYSYQELKGICTANNTHNIDISKKEIYLSNNEFEVVFGVTKSEFAKLPQWKQIKSKKSTGLF